MAAIGARTADGEGDLVRRAQRGDAAAFDALVAGRIDAAYRLAVAILRSEADAQDAVQDAFLDAWRSLPSLRDTGRLDAWLGRIVVNRCRMVLRHRRVVAVREIRDPDRPSSGLDTVRDLGADRLGSPAADAGFADAELVRAAFTRLNADQRSLLVLHHVEDRSVAEITAVLGIPAGTVKWRLHAAREALAAALGEVGR